jgi:hypothetical protein
MGPNKIQEAQFFALLVNNRRERTNYWQSPGHSLYFKANDDRLNFNNRGNLGNANDNYSSGLLFLGSAQYNRGSPVFCGASKISVLI